MRETMALASRYLGCLVAAGVLLAAGARAPAQGGWTFNAGRPNLAFVRDSVRLVREGSEVRHLDRPGPVTIEAEIQDTGPGVARNVTIRVTDNGKTVGEQHLPLLVTGATYQLRQPWDARRGPHEVKIVLDPGNRVAETDETDNLAAIDAPVPALMWPLLLIVVIVVAAGGLAGYAAWQLSARPRTTRAPKRPAP
jgi:hypothetical protein